MQENKAQTDLRGDCKHQGMTQSIQKGKSLDGERGKIEWSKVQKRKINGGLND